MSHEVSGMCVLRSNMPCCCCDTADVFFHLWGISMPPPTWPFLAILAWVGWGGRFSSIYISMRRGPPWTFNNPQGIPRELSGSLRAVSGQLQCSSQAVSAQLPYSLRAVSGQSPDRSQAFAVEPPSSFHAVSSQSPGSFQAVSVHFLYSF